MNQYLDRKNTSLVKPKRSKQNKHQALAFLSLVSAISSTASAAVMEDLGTLTSDNSGYSTPYGWNSGITQSIISADGRVVIGQAQTDAGTMHAFRYNEGDAKMTDLGTLKSDNSGDSYASAVSADGKVVVGRAQTDTGDQHAFSINEGASHMTDLGTLKSDNSGDSYANAVSADGKVVVGRAQTDTGDQHAFRYSAAHMTDLGTLASGNVGYSYANAVSADGKVVVGMAQTDAGTMHAFRHNEGDATMTDLGTLRSDNSGWSYVSVVSADGRVVVGKAETDAGYQQAYRHNEGNVKMTGLGTLKSDNSGNSSANSVSADGKVVAGWAQTDLGDTHAFKHAEGDTRMRDLGTLKSDNTGNSSANSVSADGKVVVGNAQTDNGEEHAFKHSDALGMEDLGTLGGDYSSAKSVSANGSVIVGESVTANGNWHAFIYKTKMVDVDDSGVMLNKAAEQQTAALNFMQDKLTDALYQGCRPDTGKTCFATGAKYYQQSNHAVDDTAVYVNMAHSFDPKFYAGAYLEQSVSSGFADSIDANNEQPLVAVYGGFRPSGDKLGLQVRAAAANHKVNADITRPSTAYTEAGKGNSSFKGYSGQLEAAYALQATDKVIVSPVVGVRYSQVERGAYTEAPTVDFPVEYGKMESKQTNLFAGVETEINLSEKIDAYANVGLEQVLDHSETAFSAKAPYLGGLAYDAPDVRDTKAYASTGVSYRIAPNQKIGLGVGYRQSSYKSSKDGLNAQIGYSLQF